MVNLAEKMGGSRQGVGNWQNKNVDNYLRNKMDNG